jgi:hypothetical protein
MEWASASSAIACSASTFQALAASMRWLAACGPMRCASSRQEPAWSKYNAAFLLIRPPCPSRQHLTVPSGSFAIAVENYEDNRGSLAHAPGGVSKVGRCGSQARLRPSGGRDGGQRSDIARAAATPALGGSITSFLRQRLRLAWIEIGAWLSLGAIASPRSIRYDAPNPHRNKDHERRDTENEERDVKEPTDGPVWLILDVCGLHSFLE